MYLIYFTYNKIMSEKKSKILILANKLFIVNRINFFINHDAMSILFFSKRPCYQTGYHNLLFQIE